MGRKRDRLRKQDREGMVNALTSAGFRVQTDPDRIEVTDPATNRYVGGFYWTPGSKHQAGGWRFDVAVMESYSKKDFNDALIELNRVRGLAPRLWKAWRQYRNSPSEKRWSSYRTLVAALLLRQNPKEK